MNHRQYSSMVLVNNCRKTGLVHRIVEWVVCFREYSVWTYLWILAERLDWCAGLWSWQSGLDKSTSPSGSETRWPDWWNSQSQTDHVRGTRRPLLGHRSFEGIPTARGMLRLSPRLPRTHTRWSCLSPHESLCFHSVLTHFLGWRHRL